MKNKISVVVSFWGITLRFISWSDWYSYFIFKIKQREEKERERESERERKRERVRDKDREMDFKVIHCNFIQIPSFYFCLSLFFFEINTLISRNPELCFSFYIQIYASKRWILKINLDLGAKLQTNMDYYIRY